MASFCPECGATVPEDGSCRDHFHAMLALEWTLHGGPSHIAHFYAVSTYGLQHPDSMNYTEETLIRLYASITDLLEGHATLDEVLLATRRAANGSVRVTRREDDSLPVWHRGGWPMTVADVLTVEAETDAYLTRVRAWARSACEMLSSLPLVHR